MKESKKEFKYATCRKSQEKYKADAMAATLWN